MANTTHPAAERTIPPGRLWFAFTGGAAAWALEGALCVFISSNACDAAGSLTPGGLSGVTVRLLLALVTLALLATALTAGITAFKDWRRLVGGDVTLNKAEGRGREEFMSLAGWIVGSLCALGIFWAGLPVILLNICERAH
jgi:hypothetical protein